METKKENLNSNYGYFYNVKEKIISQKSKYQNLEIILTEEFGKVLLLDGITQVGEKDHFQYHELITHPNLLTIKEPKDVLVVGGGDGGVNREVLKHPTIKKLDHVELDEDVVLFSKKHLTSISDGAFEDERVNVIIEDGRSFLEKNNHLYDSIIMDLTDPFGPALKLYTKEFFSVVKKSLKENGKFSMHVESPTSQPQLFSQIVNTLKNIFPQFNIFYNYIKMYGCLWAVAVCSLEKDNDIFFGDNIDQILESRGIANLNLINQKTFQSMQTSFPYIENLLKNNNNMLTDNKVSKLQSTKNGLMSYQ